MRVFECGMDHNNGCLAILIFLGKGLHIKNLEKKQRHIVPSFFMHEITINRPKITKYI